MADREQDVPRVRQVSAFWSAQLLGWGLYAVAGHLITIPSLADPSLGGHLSHIGWKIFKSALGCGLSLFLYRFYEALWPRRWSLLTLGLIGTVASTVIGAVWNALYGLAYGHELINADTPRNILNSAFVFLAWSALYFSVRYRREAAAET